MDCLGLWIMPIFNMILDVTQFWRDKLLSWWHSKSPRDRLFHTLANAQSYEEWEEAAFELDELLSKDLWRQNPISRHYDYRLILGRLEALMSARESEDILTLVNLLRSGLVRNLGNITSTKLFTHAYAGTKLLIDDYITQVALSIQYVTGVQPTLPSLFTSQAKLELLHDTRQAFGRTTLLLQGGSAFGLCHLGVVKALHLQGLLPRIVTGTATGAMIAALVGIHSEDELLPLLDGEGIDLSAFERRKKANGAEGNSDSSWFGTFYRRMKRLFNKGYLFDVAVLEECVRANVGDLTFEEAYARSKRILNITVATTGKNGTPNLLNYLTAPNVLIWSAAVASNASSATALYSPVTIYCKDETGTIVPWPHTQDAIFRPWRHVNYNEGESPLSRISELFNVNHFIVSQARPYLVPFLRSELNLLDRQQTGWNNLSRSLMRLIIVELRHRLRQLDYLGLLPSALSRLLIDDTIPGPNLTLVPDLCFWDLSKLFQSPTRDRVAEWTLKGERGVWPAISALKVREAVEIELDRGYQLVRRRRPSDASLSVSVPRQPNIMNEGVPRKRRGGSENEDGILADRE
ncbi:Acyl transferase/acyl hydrolase/lysophospholipase [Penicillium soppii]|uniref:Acyl transferase/acyl hydrolase/lysophospholipase n=1 Tax=Penicillium soppii TaxID=69789 RepID=UPI002548DE0D|nr:Acyl transferase/acyl hydrolase/lysophospholipase [Penicillium soppii]KAJ5855787.1 Acyl transferase/acyl hydrolase/lysophospholipase [Penicillium soppii]